jgi:colicin import membrane protein
MAKPGITYEQVAQACQSLLDEKEKITLRAIVSITGGSPNNVLKFWKEWRQQQDDIAMGDIEETLSLQAQQAILAECARKTASIKEVFHHKIAETEQQLAEVRKLFANAEQELAETHSQIGEQAKKLAVSDQRYADAEHRLKEIEALYRTAIMAQERTQTEKEAVEKHAADLQHRLNELTNEFKALQASKHQADLEIASFKARQNEREKLPK